MEPTSNIQQIRYRLKESRIKRAEYDNTVWAVALEAGTPYEEVFKPEFWSNVTVARNMKIGDEIKLFPDEGHYFARLYIRDVGRMWAKVAELYKKDFDGAQTTAGEDAVINDFIVKYQGRVNKHVVIRVKDNQMLQSGFNSVADAQTWIVEHRKALAA